MLDYQDDYFFRDPISMLAERESFMDWDDDEVPEDEDEEELSILDAFGLLDFGLDF